MLVSTSDMRTYLGYGSSTTYDTIWSPIHNAVEKWIKNYTGHDFESTTYTNEMYDGPGDSMLFLKQSPIISVSRVSTDREDAIKIKNTSTDATTALVVVDSDSLDLTVTGGTNNHAVSALAFSTYTTLTLLVDAINAVGKGWSAELYDSDYASIKSTNLLPQTLTCTSWAGITATYEYIQMAGEPINDFRVYTDRGGVYYSGGFSSGHQNVAITYTAGYSTVPEDVAQAVKIATQYLYSSRDNNAFGISRFAVGDYSVTYRDSNSDLSMPLEVKELLSVYKKVVIG